MTTEKDPWYPWFPRNFNADEPVLVMSLEAEGCYRRLLDHQWLHGSVPSDMAQLARICKNVPVARMRKLWREVAACFHPVDGDPDRLQNRKLERVRETQLARRQQQVESGRRGGLTAAERRRAQSDEGSDPTSNPSSDPTSEPTASLVANPKQTRERDRNKGTTSSSPAREDREEPDLTALTAKAKQVQATVEAAATGPEAAVQVAGFRAMVYKSRSPHGFLCEIGALLDGLRMTPAPTPSQVLAAMVRMYTNGCPAEARVLHGYVRWAITGEEPKDTRRTDFDRRRGTRTTSAVPPRDESLPRLTG